MIGAATVAAPGSRRIRSRFLPHPKPGLALRPALRYKQ